MNEPKTKEGRPVNVILGPGLGWSHHDVAGAKVHVKGYVFDGATTLEGDLAARHLWRLFGTTQDDEQLRRSLTSAGGHFAFVIEAMDRTIAAVDRVRSVPLLYALRDGALYLDDRGNRLRKRLGLGVEDIDPEQALAAAMSGYTIGARTLYRDMHDLGVGEALVADASGVRTLSWFIYDAWKTEEIGQPERRLKDLHRFMLERLVTSVGGRAICVPLSAGYDSRFIVSGLKAVGAKDVRTFSYGRPGNHEAETARLIAERLGYPWRMVGYTTRNQTAKFRDSRYVEALWETTDTCVAAPFEQDWTGVETLRRDGFIPADAVIVNGQSGDFITGNHAPMTLMDMDKGLSPQERCRLMMVPFLKKHYRLWDALATPDNDAKICGMLEREAVRAGATFSDGEAIFGIYEYLEYVNRQAKYVVSGQRAYEAMGLSWRLPLWDDEYISFWQHAPAHLKREQNLYRRVLETENWGGVFRSIPVNKKTITPGWIRPIRFAFKLAHAPLGGERWHRFERRMFGWWMDALRMSAVVPYSKTRADKRGSRNAVSWITEKWLSGHGIAWNGGTR